MKKFLPLVAVIALTLGLAACTPAPVDIEGGDGAASSQPLPDTPQARIIQITTDNWKFTPNAVSVKKGEKVTIRLTGIAGTHGFMVPDLGINTTVAAGKTVDIELPTDAAGEFAFRCSVPCGPGHMDMTGMITITE